MAGRFARTRSGSSPRFATSSSTPAWSTTTTTRIRRPISTSLISPGRLTTRATIPNESVRLTWQADQKDKLQFWFTNQNKAREFYGISSSVTPDGAGRQSTRYAQPITLKWTRTQTNKLLLEGGVGVGRTYFDNGYRESVTSSFDRETIQNTPIYSITDQANGKIFGASIVGYMAFGGDMTVARFVEHLRHRLARLEGGRRDDPRPRTERRPQLVHRRRDDDLHQRESAGGDPAHPGDQDDGYGDRAAVSSRIAGRSSARRSPAGFATTISSAT